MLPSRALTIRLIRLAMAASLLLPLLLFSFASWTSYSNIRALATERLIRSLDIQEQEAAKTFELVDLAMHQAQDLVASLTAAEIVSNEEKLHARLADLAHAVRAVQSIWIYAPDGRVLASSWMHPPPTKTFADRDFVAASGRSGANNDLYYGRVYSSLFDAEPFFTVSQSLNRDGVLVGILELSVLPSNFFRFFSTLASTQGLQYALIRADGRFLARYPEIALDRAPPLGESSNFHRVIAAQPEGGFYRSRSPIDGVDRVYAVRRLGSRSLYLSAGIEENALRNEWLGGMAYHLIFGVPATLLMFVMLFTILRRTQRLYAEIDARTQAEEALRRSQRLDAIGQLTGGVAHDFNNLLTIILGNLEGLQRQLGVVDANIKRRLENAMHGANRAATLTKRLLAFSRQQPLNPSSVNVNQLMNGLSDFFYRALGEDIELEVVAGAGLWSVEVDQPELESALVNLAVNARDAMPAGGKLTIEASNAYLDEAYCSNHAELRAGQYVMIAVSDTGHGMSKEIIERIFEPFFTTKQPGQGTGLGLSQVYGFVKQSGGHINVYSEPGEGTTVKIYLRRYYGDLSAPEVPIRVPCSQGGECLLVVEDDTDVREFIVEALNGLGYEVLHAENGATALRILEQRPEVRLLLTDVVMPGLNGRQLAEAAVAKHPSLKVLYMTGYSRNAIVHQGRLDADVALIQKPISTERLATALRLLLDPQEAR